MHGLDLLCVNADLKLTSDHSPCVEHENAYNDGVEHDLGRELEFLLNEPEGTDANQLCGNTDNEQIR